MKKSLFPTSGLPEIQKKNQNEKKSKKEPMFNFKFFSFWKLQIKKIVSNFWPPEFQNNFQNEETIRKRRLPLF